MADWSFLDTDDDIIDHSVSMANVEHVDDDVSSEDDGSLDDIGAENNNVKTKFPLDEFNDMGLFIDEGVSNAEKLVKAPSEGHKHQHVSLESTSTATPSQQHNDNMDKLESDDGLILEDDNSFLPDQSSRVLGTFGRQQYKGGCLAAYHKRVSAILDDDDQLIMDMREKGFSDRAISEKLVKIGGFRYDQKSIGTRIMRIRLAQAANVDFLLAEGYKEWELEDDNLLIKAYAIADIETNYEIERVRSWRFRKVSEYIRRFNKESIFSATACRKRYEAITVGAASIPTEQDDEPDLRRAEREAFCLAREEARNKEKAEKDAKEAIEAQAKEEAKALRAQKAEEVAHRIAAKQNETAQRLMKRASYARIRAEQATANRNAKTQRNRQIKRQKAEAVAKLNKAEAKRAGNKTAVATLPHMKDVTIETPDPRGYLSLRDLRSVCAERGFDTTGKAKDELIQELRNADEEWSKDDLTKMCRAKHLPINGTKVQIRYRIALAAAENYPSFKAGLAAAEEDVEMDMDMN